VTRRTIFPVASHRTRSGNAPLYDVAFIERGTVREQVARVGNRAWMECCVNMCRAARVRRELGPNPLLNRTRNGTLRLGLISFALKRVLPLRAD